MHVSPRSYLSAGVAVLGAGAIALSPVQPLSPATALEPQRISTSLAVNLASAVDPIQRLVEVIQATADNIDALGAAFLDNPFPIITQIIANGGVYLQELPDIGTILEQVIGNVQNAVKAPFAVPVSCSDQESFGPCENVNSTVPVILDTPFGDLTQQAVFALLPLFFTDEQYAALKPILDFTTSPISGALLSLIGPVVAPVLSVVNSVTSVIDYLGESDFQSAIFELINLPTNAIDAFLNGGQFLNLTPLVSLLGVTLPDAIKSIGFNMGGLLSPGGVMFDGLAFEAGLGELSLVDPGLSVGPIGALGGLANFVAKSIVVTPPGEAEAPVEPEAPVELEAPAEAATVAAPVADAAPEMAAPEVAAPEAAPAAEVAETPAAEPVAVAEVAAPEAVSPASDPAPTPKRVGRGAAIRGGDASAPSAAASDSDAKPAARASAARRAG